MSDTLTIFNRFPADVGLVSTRHCQAPNDLEIAALSTVIPMSGPLLALTWLADNVRVFLLRLKSRREAIITRRRTRFGYLEAAVAIPAYAKTQLRVYLLASRCVCALAQRNVTIGSSSFSGLIYCDFKHRYDATTWGLWLPRIPFEDNGSKFFLYRRSAIRDAEDEVNQAITVTNGAIFCMGKFPLRTIDALTLEHRKRAESRVMLAQNAKQLVAWKIGYLAEKATVEDLNWARLKTFCATERISSNQLRHCPTTMALLEAFNRDLERITLTGALSVVLSGSFLILAAVWQQHRLVLRREYETLFPERVPTSSLKKHNVECPECGRPVKAAGLRDHVQARHGSREHREDGAPEH
uniref:C2H2-type domain-containing protein n=1 Tax=Mycena chlorophos TaxID=658473 RepID=A0ABQ0LJE3_MYCCL|nr:predicted protein [Mycena chlorophos]